MSQQPKIIIIESNFLKLARKFRFAMHLYGLTEDVGLLIAGRRGNGSILGKVLALLMVLSANLLASYVLAIHLLSEYRALELRRSQLSELFESLRSHLSRLFSLTLVLTWHLNSTKIERLFLDCQRYYATFHSFGAQGSCSELDTQTSKLSVFQTSNYEDANKGSEEDGEKIEEHESCVLVAPKLTQPERSNFYKLTARRVRFALLLPPLHFLLNVLAVCTFPNSSVGPTAVAGRRAGISRLTISSNKTGNSTEEEQLQQQQLAWLPEILQLGMRNFHVFHSSIETAFHGRDSETVAKKSKTISALYCLAELAVYSIYFHGPRIVCATCLSIILHIHQLCIKQLERILVKLLQHPNSHPLEPESLSELVKRYDLMRLMHERIERTFKWSIMLWFTLMFISCLMHIFSFTEMTTISAAASTSNTNNRNSQVPQQQKLQVSESSSSISVILFRLASALFVCYSPALIYTEAFRIELSSNRVEQLVMRLSRRPGDSLAQSLELSLFDPICLSVGEYFHLSKRSLSALLGATVTFSVMFIELDGHLGEKCIPLSDPTHNLRIKLVFLLIITNQPSPSVIESSAKKANHHHHEMKLIPNNKLKSEILLDVDEEDEDDTDKYYDDDENEGDEDDDEEEDDQNENADEEEEEGEEVGYEEGNIKQKSVTAVEVNNPSSADEDKDFSLNHPRYPLLENEISSNLMDFGSQSGAQRPADEPYNGLANINNTQLKLTKLKAKQRRKLRRLNQLRPSPKLRGSNSVGRFSIDLAQAQAAPKLASKFTGRVRENERMVELDPKLQVLNQVEVCDFELLLPTASDTFKGNLNSSQSKQIPFLISWIDRVSGEATLEARDQQLMDCERERNYTFKMRALGCNGLQSNEATVTIQTEDVNEFSPEFERLFYSLTLDWRPLAAGVAEHGGVSEKIPLLNVVARDADCSPEFNRVCRYELLAGNPVASSGSNLPPHQQLETLEGLSVDAVGLIQMSLSANSRPLSLSTSTYPEGWRRNFQVIAYDCAGKKSQNPAQVELNFNHICKPALKDVDSRIVYRPLAGEKSPFSRAHLDLCGLKCHRPNISVLLQLQTGTTLSGLISSQSNTNLGADKEHFSKQQTSHKRQTSSQQQIHCDRDTYSMVARRRLCGAQLKTIELLPPFGLKGNWLLPKSENNSSTSNNPELDESDSDSLNEYSLDGSYGKRALRFASAQNWRQTKESTETKTQMGGITPLGSPQSDPSSEEPTANRKHRTRHHQHYRSRGRGRLSTRHAPSSERKRVPDPSSVYRDRVYHFGATGRSSALLIPHSVWNHQHLSNDETITKSHELPLLFGREHSLSFWMRHSDKFSNNSSNMREHLLCSTFAQSEEQQVAAEAEPPLYAHAHPLATSGSSRLHHLYALSVHNCRLILLMRRKPGEFEPELSGSQRDVYLPSEWRWTLSENQLCDDHWHLYTLNVRYPFVELYVDGQQFEESYDSLVIVDDLPLPQSTNKYANPNVAEQQLDESPSLSLGACWDSRAQTWTGGAHFRGYLSGLSVLVNATEDLRTIECMGKCSEALVSTANLNTQQNGPTPTLQDPQATSEQAEQREQQQLDNSLVAYQESSARILLNGHDFFDIEDALSQIAYVNKRPLPSIGQRFITVTTSIECQPQASASSNSLSPTTSNNISSMVINISPVSVQVDVQASSTLPSIQLAGTPNLAREYAPFIQGIKPFGSLSIRVKRLNLSLSKRHRQQKQQQQKSFGLANDSRSSSDLSDYIDDSTSSLTLSSSASSHHQYQQQKQKQQMSEIHTIEACTVRLYPPLNSLHETLLLPVHELKQLSLYWHQTPDYLAIYGLDSAQNFEHLLREIVYKNAKPALYLERVFRLVCSDLNGRLVSNEYQQTVTIIHLKPLDDATPEDTNLPASTFSLLRQSEWPTIETTGENLHLPLDNNKHSDHYFQPLSLAQSSRLDRIAVAFLVFLVSLVVIVLVIALTNLKERPNQTPHNRHSRRHKEINNTQDPEQALDTLYVSDDEDEDEEGEEEEEDEEDEREDFYKQHLASPRAHHTKVVFNRKKHSDKLVPHDSTDLDSLSWDDGEGFECKLRGDDSSSIVMNPLFQKLNNTPDESPQQLLVVQRPDASGAMRSKPKSQLTSKSFFRWWSMPTEKSDELPDDYNDDQLSLSLHHQQYEPEEFRLLNEAQQHRGSSCFSAGSGSASSSSSGSSTESNSELESEEEDSSSSFVDEEDERIAARGRCLHSQNIRSHAHTHSHAHQVVDEEPTWLKHVDEQTSYELHHCHHFHHTCLRKLATQHSSHRVLSTDQTVGTSSIRHHLPDEEHLQSDEENSMSENELFPPSNKQVLHTTNTWSTRRRRTDRRRRSIESA